jgi:hypothetical protein
LPKLKDVLMGGAPNAPNALLSSGFFVAKGCEVVDGAPKEKGDVETVLEPLGGPPNKVLPFVPFNVAPPNVNDVPIADGFPFNCISLTGLSSILTS